MNIPSTNNSGPNKTTNGLPLSDITNTVQPLNQPCYELPSHAVGSCPNSSQPTQLRRRVGRPRLSERPVNITNNATNTTPRRRGRPPTRVINPLPTHNISQPTPQNIVSSRTVIDTNGNPIHFTGINTINQVSNLPTSTEGPLNIVTTPQQRLNRPPASAASASVRRNVRQPIHIPDSSNNDHRNSTKNTDINQVSNLPTSSEGSLNIVTTPLRRRGRPPASRASPSVHRNVRQAIHIPDSLNNDHRNSTQNTDVYRNARKHRRMFAYWDCGEAVCQCIHCGALLWYAERTIKTYSPRNPKFSLCCGDGKVQLPFLQPAPGLLTTLMDYNGDDRSQVFRKHMKLLCSMFSFTSTGGKVCTDINDGGGPYTFRLNGHNHHRMGTLLPTHEDGRPRFSQLYIYDTENEVENRFYALNRRLTSSREDIILRSLVQDLISMLDEHNWLVQAFRMARERFSRSSMQPVTLRLIGTRQRDGRQYNLPTASEVAALIPGDGNPTDSRDVIVEERGGEPGRNSVKRISELHPSFMALQYPLLFPYGEDGFHLNIPLNVLENSRRKSLSMREYYCFRLHHRRHERSTLHSAGRLFHTFVVDAYSAVLEHDLDWYKRNQDTIRSELYSGLEDRIINGDTDLDAIDRRVILPSSFTGGPRHMLQQYQDAMAICRWAGTPDLFVTMTCNPRWPEIQREIDNAIPGQPACDRPDLIARVFKIKLDELMTDIRKNNHFGQVKAVIYTIEFQKRGLPHCHAIVFLHDHDKLFGPAEIDHVISAELPSEEHDPIAFEVVRSHMMHGPCGELNRSNSCMSGDKCTKAYPKEYCEETFVRRDGWPRYKRPNNGRKAKVGRKNIPLDNRFVVPHNIDLLVKYGCHINVEWCNQGSLVKYLFSYLNKGPDRLTVLIEGQNSRTSFAEMLRNENEIEGYLNCRYISASEACWRLFGFEMHYRSIAVERLPFHEEHCNRVYFSGNERPETVLDRPSSLKTKFTEWMTANRLYPDGRDLTYAQYPSRFTWHDQDKEWRPRGNLSSIGRIYYVSPSSGETYYLRMLLNVVRGAMSFDEIKTVDGIKYPTYMSACKALNLLGDDVEWVQSIKDASQWKLGNQLRELFVTILLFCEVSDHAHFFREALPYLSEDVVYDERRNLENENVVFTEQEILNYTLKRIERILNGNNKSLSDFPNLPQIDHSLMNIGRNRLIAAERTFNVADEWDQFTNLYAGLNHQQRDVYDNIMQAVNAKAGGLFFVYGCGGTGKTYLWRTIIAWIRSLGKVVLSVASSGIASLLLPGGRTAHSRFRIPIEIDDQSCCGIDVTSDLADLIRITELIIWDEAPDNTQIIHI